MIASRVATRTAMVAARNNTSKQQKRGIVDYLTNYPDKVRFPRSIVAIFAMSSSLSSYADHVKIYAGMYGSIFRGEHPVF